MDEINEKWVANFLRAFRLCITSLRIYPINNSSVVNAINIVENFLSEYFRFYDTLTFVEHSGKIDIVGFENLSPESRTIAVELSKNFSKCQISSIAIKKGFTRQELVFILQNLSKYFSGDWQEEAEGRGYKNLGFNQVRYVAVSDEETVVNKISTLVSERGKDVFGVVSLLKDVYDFIDTLPPQESPKMVTHLAHELAKQDAAVLREIFERELPAKIEQSGLKEKLIASLTKEKISDIYQQIIKWYGDIKSSGVSEFEAIEQLEKLKRFLSAVLQSASAKDVPFKLYEELLNLGLIESIPAGVKREMLPEKLAEQLEIVLNLSEVQLVTSLWAEKLPEIVSKLIDAQAKDRLISLFLKVVNNYKNDDYYIRIKAMEILKEIIRIIKARGYENILTFGEHLFVAWLENENIRTIYEPLSEILFDRLINRLLSSDFDTARKIFELFKTLGSELNMDEEKKRFILSFFDKKVPNVIPILLNDVKSPDEVKKKNAFEFLSKLDKDALDPLVKIVKEVEDVHLRLLAAGILKNLGQVAIVRIKEELNLGLTKDEIKRFIEVLKFIGDGWFYNEVRDLLRYPDSEIKIEILRYLSLLELPEVDKLLNEYLGDRELAKSVVKMMSQRKSQEFVASLIHLLSTTSDWGLKEEIVIAMGEISDKRFEKPLINLLKSRRGLFSRNSAEQEKVRLRAAYVLRRFKGSQGVLAALRKASKDRSQAVAITAAESLRLLESSDVQRV